MEDVVILEDGYSSEDPPSPRTAMDRCKSDTSATVQAILRTSKQEREELIRVRNKLFSVLKFMKSKGYSEEMVLAGLKEEGYCSCMMSRDEFGLPVFGDKTESRPIPSPADKVLEHLPQSNPFKDKMKSKIEEPPTVKQAQESVKEPVKSWSQVAQSSEIELDFCPLPKGTSVVCLPDEVLRKGLDKFKWCVVGHFTKGTMPLSSVTSIASKLWSSKGLISVMQKEGRKFIFKFNSAAAMHSVLAHGTWYFERKPMVVTPWGKSVEQNQLQDMPLWIKLSNVPDCYWTKEGISCLASVVGKPLFADKLTSKFETLPFAKVCVLYEAGKPLPTSIPAITLDPMTENKIQVEVRVEYPSKLLFCSGCKSLGHITGACPITKRVWVAKEKPVESIPSVASSNPTRVTPDPVPQPETLEKPVSPPSPKEAPWIEVKRKGHTPSTSDEESPSPLQTFKSLKRIDEIEQKAQQAKPQLSKHQLKKLKKSQGKSSPSSAH